MRHFSLFLVLGVLLAACSDSSVPASSFDECLSLCESEALCGSLEQVSCEELCGQFVDASERFACAPQLEEYFACSSAEGMCDACREEAMAWTDCAVNGTLMSAAEMCNTWTCMSWPAAPSSHEECVSIMQEWVFLNENDVGRTWIERGQNLDECALCTAEHFGPQTYGECSFGEVEWKTACPVCAD